MTRASEHRPWGYFVVLEDTRRCKVKRLVVHAGRRLSLQKHLRRAEHWTVVRGAPHVTVGDRTWQATVGETVEVPVGVVHRIANHGTEDVEIIEVQTGSYFGEDDIVRLSDDYGRVEALREAERAN